MIIDIGMLYSASILRYFQLLSEINSYVINFIIELIVTKGASHYVKNYLVECKLPHFGVIKNVRRYSVLKNNIFKYLKE